MTEIDIAFPLVFGKMAHAFQSNCNQPFEAPRFGRNFGINFDTVVVSGFSRHVKPKQIVDFFTLEEGHCACVSTKSDPPSVLLRFRSPVIAQKVLMRYNNADLHGQKLQVLPSNNWHSTIPGVASRSTNVLPLMQNNACIPTPNILPRPVQVPPSLSEIPRVASILNLAKALHLFPKNNLQRNAFLHDNTQTSLSQRKLSSSGHSPCSNRQRNGDKGNSGKANKCLGNGSRNADKGSPRTGNPNDKHTVEKAQETAHKEIDVKKCPKNQSDKKNLELKGPVIRRKRLRKRTKDVNVRNSKRSRTAVVCKTSSEVTYSGDQNMEKSDEISLQKAHKVTKKDGNSLASDNDKDKLDTKTTIHSKDNTEEIEKTKAKKDEASADSLQNKSTTERQRSPNQRIGDKKERLRNRNELKDKREGGNKTIQKESILENENPADGAKNYNEESKQVTQRINSGKSLTRKIKPCYHTLTSKDSVNMNDSSKNSVWSGQKERKESTMTFENENNSLITSGSNNVTGVKLEDKSEKQDSIPRNSNAGDGVDNKGKKMEGQRSTVSLANAEKIVFRKSGYKVGVDTKKTDDNDTANNVVVERKSVRVDIVSKNGEKKCRELKQGSAGGKFVKQSGSGSNDGDIIKKSDPNNSASGSKSANRSQGVDRDWEYLTSESNHNKTGEFGRNEKRFAPIGELKPVQKDSETNVKKCACGDNNKRTGCCSEFQASASNFESKKKDLANNIKDTLGKHVTASTNDKGVQGNAKEDDVGTKSDGAENEDLILCMNSKSSLGRSRSNFGVKAPINSEKRNEETSGKIGSTLKKSANSSKSLIEHNAKNSNAKNRSQSTNHLQKVANGKNSSLENKRNGSHGQEKKPRLEKSLAKAPRVDKANDANKMRQVNENVALLQSDVILKSSTSPAKKQISLNASRQLSTSRNAESGEKTNPKSSLSKEDAARKSNYIFLNNTRKWKYAGLARNCERDRIRFRRRLDRSPPHRHRSFSPSRKSIRPPRIKGGRMFEKIRSPDRTCLRNKSARNAADVATRKRSFEATGLVVAPLKKKRLDTKSAERNNEVSRDLPQPLMSVDLSNNSKIVPKKNVDRSPSPPRKKMCLDNKSIERINKAKSTDENRSMKTGSTGNTECPKKVGSVNTLDTKKVVGTSFKATGLLVAPPKQRCLDNKRTVINNSRVGTKRAVRSNDLRNVLLEKNNGERYGKGENILGDNTHENKRDGFRCGKPSEPSDISTSNVQKDKDLSLVKKTSDCPNLNNEKFAGDAADSDFMTISSVDKVMTPKTSAKDTTHKHSDNSSIGSTSSLEQIIQKKLDVPSPGELESGSLKRSESINNISMPNIPGDTSVEKNYTNQDTPTEDENKIEEINDFDKESILRNSTSSKITMSPCSTGLSNKNNFGVEFDHTDGDTANNIHIHTTENNANNGGDKLKFFCPNTSALRDDIQKDVDMKVGDEDQMLVQDLLQETNNLKENLEENACHVNQFSRSVAGFSTVITFKAGSILTEHKESENENRNQSDSLAVPKISEEDSLKNNRACGIPEQLDTVTKPILSKKTSSEKTISGLGKSKIILAKLKSLKMNAQETFKKLSKVSVTANSESSTSHVGESPLIVPKLACESKSVDVDNEIAKSPEIQSANNMYRRIEKIEENNEVFLQKHTSKIVSDKQHVTKQNKIECTSLETRSSPTCEEIPEKSTASTIAPALLVIKDLKKFEENNLQTTEDQRVCVTRAEDSRERNSDALSASNLSDKTLTADISETKQETQLWNKLFSAKDDLTIPSNSLKNNQGTELTNATCDALSPGDSSPWDIDSSSFSTTMRNDSDVERVKTIKLEPTSPPNEEEGHSSMFGGPNDDAVTFKTTSSSEAPSLRTASAILSDVKTGGKVNVEETLRKDDERFSADYEQVKRDFRRTCNSLRNLNNSVLTNIANSKTSVASSTMSDHVQDTIMTSASSVPTEDMSSNTLKNENEGHSSRLSDDSTEKNLIHVLKEAEFSERIPNTTDSNKKLLLEESQAVLAKCNGGSTVEAPESLDSIETKLIPVAVETSSINENESEDRLIEDSRQGVLKKSQNDICGDNEEPLNWEDVLNETMEYESLIDCSSKSLLDFVSIDKVQIPFENDDQDERRRNSIENEGLDVNNSHLPRNISITGEKRRRDDEPAEVARSKHQKRLSQSQDDSLYDAQNNASDKGTDLVNGLSDVERSREKQERCFILKNILALEEQYEGETTALLNNVKMLASMDPSLSEKLKVTFEDCLAKIGQSYISKLYELNQEKENYMNEQYCAQANNGPQSKPTYKSQRTAKGKIRNQKSKGEGKALKNTLNDKEQSTAQGETTTQQKIDVGITPQNKQQSLSLCETLSTEHR